MKAPSRLAKNVSLAPFTTFEVGGPARFLARCSVAEELRETLAWGNDQGLEIVLLGGGSNLLVSDAGFEGLIVQLTDRRLEFHREGDTVRLEVGAGLGWDELVTHSVARGLAGIETLAGIPGTVGAAPIQNIGAYGQELSDTLEAVDVVDLETGEQSRRAADACELGYRSSLFKTRWAGRFAITALSLRLRPGGSGAVHYRDLEERFADASSVTPAEVRRAVLEIRRAKSMVLDPTDPNRRSAGSFFVNPVLPNLEADGVRERVAALRGEEAARAMPRFPRAAGQAKLSAAWLIEAAGFHRGYGLGAAGISTRHVLALINRGGARASDLVELAARVHRRVRQAFGVALHPEPRFLGFEKTADELLESS